MAEHVDGCYAVCPYCGEKHGDCWEWLTSEEPIIHECQNNNCGKKFYAWAVYDVQYYTCDKVKRIDGSTDVVRPQEREDTQ